MEFPNERESPTASPRGSNGDSGAAAPPPPTKPNAKGGGVASLGAQGATGAGDSNDQGAVVPPSGSGVIDGDQRESGEKEKEDGEGGNGGGGTVATPLDDLNIQWTSSTSSSSEEIAEGPPVGGDAMVVDDGSEGVPITHPVELSAQPVTTEEGRDVAAPTKEVVIVEEAESSDEESGEAGGDRWRVWPRGGEAVVMTKWGIRGVASVSGSGAGGGSDDPNGKRVAIEEPVREQGPVGIFRSGGSREEVVGQREREMDVLCQATLDAEAETEEWIREVEEEEAEFELRAWEELEVAQGPRVSVVEEAAVV